MQCLKAIEFRVINLINMFKRVQCNDWFIKVNQNPKEAIAFDGTVVID